MTDEEKVEYAPGIFDGFRNPDVVRDELRDAPDWQLSRDLRSRLLDATDEEIQDALDEAVKPFEDDLFAILDNIRSRAIAILAFNAGVAAFQELDEEGGDEE